MPVSVKNVKNEEDTPRQQRASGRSDASHLAITLPDSSISVCLETQINGT